MTFLRQLFIWVSVIAASPSLLCERAPVLRVDTGFTSHNLRSYLWYQADSTGTAAPETVYQHFRQGTGEILKDEIPNLGDGDVMHWVAFSLRNTSAETLKFMLQIGFSMIDDVSYYIFHGDSLISSRTGLSFEVPNEARPIPHRVFAYPIGTSPDGEYTVLLRLRKSDGILVLLINLYGEKDFWRFVELDNLQHGMAIGLLVLATLLGLFLFALSRQALYGFYALYILGILGFVLSDQGYLSQYLAPHRVLFSGPGSWAFFVMLSVAAHTIFSLIFLKITVARYRVWVIISWIMNAVAFAFCLYLLTGFRLTDLMYRLALLITLVYVILVFVFLVLGLKRRITEAWLYLAAVGPFFFTVIFKCMALFGLIADSWLIVNLLYYSPVLEVLVLLFGLAYNFRRNEKIKTAMAIDLAKSKEKSALITVAVQESERKRIAEDLHDDLGNVLAALQLQLSSDNPDIHKARKTVLLAGESLRNISHDLIPAEFERSSLSEVLQETVAKFNKADLVRWVFVKAGHEIEWPKSRALLIYRIATELMTNALKHSHAEKVVIETVYQPESMILIVQDNGSGFDGSERREMGDGLGLRSIRSRVKQLNGKLEINTGAAGTTVIIEVPYENDYMQEGIQ